MIVGRDVALLWHSLGTCSQKGNTMGNTMIKRTMLSLGFLLATTAAQAQTFPSKTVTIVVGTRVGGSIASARPATAVSASCT